MRKSAFSAAELADAHLAAMERARALNAFVLETPEQARAMAQAADARLAAGDARPLEGIPLGIKDLFCTKDVRTTACSHILDNFVPTYESTVTAQLWRDGAVMLGKLNNDEFAMGSSNETSCFGPVISPWRRQGAQHRRWCRAARPAARRRRWRRALPRRDRHRHRRLDPPARGLHRHRRHQADLRPLLALGHRRVRVLARPGRPVRAHGARRRDPAALDGRARPEGHDLGRPPGAGLRGGGRQVGQGHEASASRRNTALDGMAAEIDALWEQGGAMAQGRRRRDRRGVAAAHQIRAAGLLHRGAGGSLVQPRAL